jgi:hypothetical protein
LPEAKRGLGIAEVPEPFQIVLEHVHDEEGAIDREQFIEA